MDRSFNAQVEELQKTGATVRLLKHMEVNNFKISTKYQEVQGPK